MQLSILSAFLRPVFLWLAFSIGPSLAQGALEADLSGTVTDAQGKALKDAKVALIGQKLTALTDAAGKYAFKFQPVPISASAEAAQRNGSGQIVGSAPDAIYSLTGRLLPADVESASPPFRYTRRRDWEGTPSGTTMASPSGKDPVLRKSGAPSSAGEALAASDTLTVIALGYDRGERVLTALSGTQDFKLNALRYTDVPYKTGTLTAAEKTSCMLDVHKPATGSKWPVVVHLHGGGMVEGDKAEGWTSYYNNFAYKFLDAGVMMVMPNYRLIGKGGTWPDYIRDAAAAAAWVRKNIEPYGGDPDNVFISGWSAGAYLTQMLLLDTAWLAEAGSDAQAFRGFISLSSQTRSHANLQADLKVSDIMAEKPYAMPMGHVRKIDVPFLIFVGGKEGNTITDNQALFDGLAKAGSADVSFHIIPDHAHNDMGNFMGNPTDETRTRFLDFIQTWRKR